MQWHLATMAVALTDVVVRDGSTVSVRLAEERDVPALLQLLQSLSTQSLYYRFHSLPALSTSDVCALIDVDRKATTLIAESGGRVLAFASYHPQLADPHRAEVSFAVSDAVQGHGIGTRLLEQLAKVARAAGITTFDAHVLAVNRQMMDVFRHSGFTETVRLEGGTYHVTLSLAVTDAFSEQAAARSQIA